MAGMVGTKLAVSGLTVTERTPGTLARLYRCGRIGGAKNSIAARTSLPLAVLSDLRHTAISGHRSHKQRARWRTK